MMEAKFACMVCVAVGILIGMVLMAMVRVERGDLEPEDNFDMMEDCYELR